MVKLVFLGPSLTHPRYKPYSIIEAHLMLLLKFVVLLTLVVFSFAACGCHRLFVGQRKKGDLVARNSRAVHPGVLGGSQLRAAALGRADVGGPSSFGFGLGGQERWGFGGLEVGKGVGE